MLWVLRSSGCEMGVAGTATTSGYRIKVARIVVAVLATLILWPEERKTYNIINSGYVKIPSKN